MTIERRRRLAVNCLDFADRAGDPELAKRLRLMAAEYFAKAEEEEPQTASGAQQATQVFRAATNGASDSGLKNFLCWSR